jgi:uracil-DNA glycosylase
MLPERSQGDIIQLIDAVQAHVEYLREQGVEGVPVGAVSEHEAPAVRAAAASPVAPPSSPSTPSSSIAPLAEASSLDTLRTVLGDCQRCTLAAHRKTIVFGVGNPAARLVFVGEGPGADEDAQGEPFVGRAGQLLTEIITKGMGLRREDVYICNVVKCRPPGNRNPEPDETGACEPFLHRQLELIAPQVVVALGKFAAQSLLETKTPISQLRGNWFEYRGIQLMPTFHPAYLLRNPAEKRVVWEDIKQVMARLGMAPPGR